MKKTLLETNETLADLNTTLRVYQFVNEESNYNNDQNRFYSIIDSTNFKEMNLCECYASGNVIGCTDAGCCSVENTYYTDNFELSEDDIETYEEYQEKLNKIFKEKYNEEHTTVRCFNFWNGHNYKTLAIANSNCNYSNECLKELNEELQVEILSEYFECEIVEKGLVTETYDSKNYRFVKSFHQCEYADATVYCKE